MNRSVQLQRLTPCLSYHHATPRIAAGNEREREGGQTLIIASRTTTYVTTTKYIFTKYKRGKKIVDFLFAIDVSSHSVTALEFAVIERQDAGNEALKKSVDQLLSLSDLNVLMPCPCPSRAACVATLCNSHTFTNRNRHRPFLSHRWHY